MFVGFLLGLLQNVFRTIHPKHLKEVLNNQNYFVKSSFTTKFSVKLVSMMRLL